MRVVPVVVVGAGPSREPFRRLVDDIGGDLAGREGFSLELRSDLGPEPSILVETRSSGEASVEPLLAAVDAGHAVVTAHLSSLVGESADLGVLIADRRIGLSAALVPEVPLVALLTRCRDAGQDVEEVRVEGAGAARLREEAIAIARLTGRELRVDDVSADGDLDDPGLHWTAIVGTRFPALVSRPARDDGARAGRGRRVVTVRTGRSGQHEVTMDGIPAGPVELATALLDDVLRLAREGDTPWRAHRRRWVSASRAR